MKAARRQLGLLAVAALMAFAPFVQAAERVTLNNGFEFECIRREPLGDKVRLYFGPAKTAFAEENYLDVAARSIVRIEDVPDAGPSAAVFAIAPAQVSTSAQPTHAELHEMLSRAGAQHHIDAELLASVVHAESGGHANALSRAGARGLMQLMPATALAVGVKDVFAADQNVEGGTRYLDELLARYHDNISFALAAYNAGPGAVDRFHGVPPYRETRAYVARIVREFNRRKTALLAQSR